MQPSFITINIVSQVFIDLQLVGQAVGLEVIKVLIENMDLKTPIKYFFLSHTLMLIFYHSHEKITCFLNISAKMIKDK